MSLLTLREKFNNWMKTTSWTAIEAELWDAWQAAYALGQAESAKDAERYRWLRERLYLGPIVDDRHERGRRYILTKAGGLGMCRREIDTLDAAVDEAMKK